MPDQRGSTIAPLPEIAKFVTTPFALFGSPLDGRNALLGASCRRDDERLYFRAHHAIPMSFCNRRCHVLCGGF